VITHVAVFTWAEGTTAEQVAEITAALHTLPGLIPEIRRYIVGPDAALSAGNADYAVVATFDDADGWRAYDANQEHHRIKAELIKPRLASRAAVQFEH
jgi:ABC-type molybdate transport system substrate-binding protein